MRTRFERADGDRAVVGRSVGRTDAGVLDQRDAYRIGSRQIHREIQRGLGRDIARQIGLTHDDGVLAFAGDGNCRA